MTGLLLAGVLALLGLPQLARAGRAVAWVELLLITCNDDFNSRGSNVLELLKHDPDVIFIQEGKAANYRDLVDTRPGRTGQRLLPRDLWGVHQDTSSPDRAGSVVIYRHGIPLLHTGAGWTFGVKAPGLLARWIAWVRGTIRGRRVFLLSAHPPPFRARHWWHPFNLALWVRLRTALAAGRLVLGGMDSNQHGGPAGIPRRLRWIALGRSIDGFVISRQVEVLEGPTELPKNTSDHHPVTLRVRIPVPSRKAAA